MVSWKLHPNKKSPGNTNVPIAILNLAWNERNPLAEIYEDKRDIDPFDLLRLWTGPAPSDTCFARTPEEKKQSLLSLTQAEAETNGLHKQWAHSERRASCCLVLSALRRTLLPSGRCWDHDRPSINFEREEKKFPTTCDPQHLLRSTVPKACIVDALEVFESVAETVFQVRTKSGNCTVWEWEDVWGEYKAWKKRWPDSKARKGRIVSGRTSFRDAMATAERDGKMRKRVSCRCQGRDCISTP